MKKNKIKSGDPIRPQDWQEYDEENELLNSYLKKKGKHKRAEEKSINK